MTATARMVLRLDDAAQASRMASALIPDDPGQTTITVEGATLIVETSSATLLGLIRSLDDVAGCLRGAGVQ